MEIRGRRRRINAEAFEEQTGEFNMEKVFFDDGDDLNSSKPEEKQGNTR